MLVYTYSLKIITILSSYSDTRKAHFLPCSTTDSDSLSMVLSKSGLFVMYSLIRGLLWATF